MGGVTASAILLLKTAIVSPGQPRTDGDRGEGGGVWGGG